jgi:type II secretory pathway pseudopilin PulG
MKLGQRGFGMLEVTVALGMLGVGTYIFMKQQETSSLQQQKMSFNQTVNSYVNSFQTELSKRENCSATLTNLTVGSQVTEIKEGQLDPLSTTGGIIPTGNILYRVKNPLDASGVYINSMEYLTNAAGKDVLRVEFKSGFIRSGTEVKRKVVGGNTLKKDFIINSVKDPVTNTVINCYSDFSNLSKSLEGKICAVEKKLVEAIGGVTESCNPAYSNEKLYQEGHTERHCTMLGGTKVTADGQKICRFNGANCPGGWTQFKNWSTTENKTCGATLERGGSVNNNAWNACRQNAALISRCGHGTSNSSGSHAWSNAAVESKAYQTLMKICYGGNCGDKICYDNNIGNTWVDCAYNAGGSVLQYCVATRTQIGCY